MVLEEKESGVFQRDECGVGSYDISIIFNEIRIAARTSWHLRIDNVTITYIYSHNATRTPPHRHLSLFCLSVDLREEKSHVLAKCQSFTPYPSPAAYI